MEALFCDFQTGDVGMGVTLIGRGCWLGCGVCICACWWVVLPGIENFKKNKPVPDRGVVARVEYVAYIVPQVTRVALECVVVVVL